MTKEKTKRTIGEIFLDGTVLEMIYNEREGETAFAVLSEGKISRAKKYEHKGVVYLPLLPTNSMVKEKLVRFPSRPDPYGNSIELVSEINAFLSKYVKLSEKFRDVAAHYILLSWVFEKFDQVPYLRKVGDYGTGKTRFLDVVGKICFRPVMLSGSSSVAALFHVLDIVRGTLVLDEADFSRTDERSELTKILNNGFSKGYPVYRCRLNNNKEYDPEAFQVFGTKLLASRGSFDDDALESRFITEKQGFTKGKIEGVPISLPKSFEDEALSLRNKLLKFRLEFFKNSEFKCSAEEIEGAETRVSQIFAPLIFLAINDKAKENFRILAREISKNLKVDRGATIESHVLHCISKIMNSTDKISIGDIANMVYVEYCDYHDRKITARWIGHVVSKSLGLETLKYGGRIYLSEGQDKLLGELYSKYDVIG